MNTSEELNQKVILPARYLVRDDSKIKRYYFFPWLLSVVFLTAVLSYQTIYTYVVIWNNQDWVLEKILHFLESKYVVEVAIVFVVFLLLYFLLVPIFEWGLIKYIDYKNKWEPIWSSEAFWQWMTKFLPFFEYWNLFSEFKLMSILNFYLFTIRFVWLDYLKETTIVYLIFFLFWTIFNILFVYARYSIILNNKKVMSAIWESSKIVLLSLKKTIKLYFMLFFFNFRVIINILIFLFFPILIFATVWYISSKFVMLVTVTILLSIFWVLIIAAWYLTSVLEVFKTALWYYAYEENRQKIDDEDDDDEDD